ncbi:MAG: NADAR family protein [Bacteroidota bacterium]
MKYTKKWLQTQVEHEESIKYLFFWGHQPAKDGSITKSVFSQWWTGHPFMENGVKYNSAEHYMMAGKARLFKDEEYLNLILNAESPAEAKKLGRKVRNFEVQIWEKHRCDIVTQANILKFGQHEELKSFLLGTQNRVIVEASPRDRIWGIGMGKDHPSALHPNQWRGKNLLGFCLMETRDRLRLA